MLIANPIYDIVFKYLMEDSKIAKIIISKIIDSEILSIEPLPREYSTIIEENTNKDFRPKASIPLSVYQLDFKARIKTEEGEKLVIIEIQKAKFYSDIMRFRKYLGEQYSNPNNKYFDGNREKALIIISIYFLGYSLENLKNIPVIEVSRTYIDKTTKEALLVKEEFIESLTHDSYIIQIPALKERRRNELEVLLQVFDQSQISEDCHLLNIELSNYPEEFVSIIRKLQEVIADDYVRQTMTIEDTMIKDLKELYSKVSEFEEQLAEKNIEIVQKDTIINTTRNELANKENVIAQKENVIAEKENVIAKKDNMLAEKENVIAEKENVIAEKENVIAEKENVIAEKDKALEDKDNALKQALKELELLKQTLNSK